MSTDATLALTQGIIGAGQAVVEAEAQRAQTEALQRDLEFQEQFAEARARDAIKRGESAESRQRQQVRKLIGAQRAAFAAQGIDIQSGSAFEIQSETEQFGVFDASTIRINAAREVLGIRLGIEELQFRREIAGIVGRAERRATLATAGLQLLRGAAPGIAELSKKGKPPKQEPLAQGVGITPEERERFMRGQQDPRKILSRRRLPSREVGVRRRTQTPPGEPLPLSPLFGFRRGSLFERE